MATFDAEIITLPSLTFYEQLGYSETPLDFVTLIFTEQLGYSEIPMSMSLTGSGVNPIPYYFLAMFDSLGIRRYWIDAYPSINNAPTLMVGTYDVSSFVILARY